ncbi:hypothetical protein BV25DRAFT_1787814, partial [Artomyces pyxidatus]
PSITFHVAPELIKQFRDGYLKDPAFTSRWQNQEDRDARSPLTSRFFKDKQGLLFFTDADFQPRLCVPMNLRAHFLNLAHTSPTETAHAGA